MQWSNSHAQYLEGSKEMALNRIYVKQEEIARSMYKRRKERGFDTEDLMRLHWERQGKRAKEWSREIIKRMIRADVVEAFKPDRDQATDGDMRRVMYRFTEETLRKWNLHA